MRFLMALLRITSAFLAVMLAGEANCDSTCCCENDKGWDVCGQDQCGFFKCDSGVCIEESEVCNKHDDCGDDSDEQNCNDDSPSFTGSLCVLTITQQPTARDRWAQ